MTLDFTLYSCNKCFANFSLEATNGRKKCPNCRSWQVTFREKRMLPDRAKYFNEDKGKKARRRGFIADLLRF